MRSEKKLKKSSALILLNKSIAILLVMLIPITSYSDPIVGGTAIPPGSFTRIEEPDLLHRIGLPTAWCYDDEANSMLITAPARGLATCELNSQYELEKQKIKYSFRIEKLELRISTLKEQHEKIDAIKDQEIERLTAAVMNIPNDYTAWWATGGFLTGVLVTVGVVFLVQND